MRVTEHGINLRKSVLIETLWNVNFQYITSCVWMPVRINRNIVECKYTVESVDGCALRLY